MSYFEQVTPERVGIASKGILDFLADVEHKGIEQHSLMIIRHGKCCAQGWWKPYAPDLLHPVYSFSKSLTATAIGFAEQEGLLSLDEKLVDIFPDKLPEQVSENLKEVNLHHLLTMSCGHETEIVGEQPDWIRAFLAHPFLHKPGTFYKYNTAGTNMLAAVLKRKTGQDVTAFLRPRLLEPLGIEQIFCAKLPDEDQVEAGGGGMKLTTEGMARFTYFMLHKGEWEGKQLLRRAWFDRMSAKQIETAGDSENHVKEWANGYGYQCWMGTLPQSFRADGAFGQFGFVYPTLDMIVIMTTATEQTQSLVDSMMDYLLPAVHEQELAESADAKKLEDVLAGLRLATCDGDRLPFFEEKLTGQIYVAENEESACSSLDILIGGAGLFDLQEGEITRMSFTYENDQIIWTVWEDEEHAQIAAPLDHRYALSETHGQLYGASAKWRAIGVLEMNVRRMDAISGVQLIFRFVEDEVYIEADESLMTVGGLGMHAKTLLPFVTAK